jgi:hypothetical protein
MPAASIALARLSSSVQTSLAAHARARAGVVASNNMPASGPPHTACVDTNITHRSSFGTACPRSTHRGVHDLAPVDRNALAG